MRKSYQRAKAPVKTFTSVAISASNSENFFNPSWQQQITGDEGDDRSEFEACLVIVSELAIGFDLPVSKAPRNPVSLSFPGMLPVSSPAPPQHSQESVP